MVPIKDPHGMSTPLVSDPDPSGSPPPPPYNLDQDQDVEAQASTAAVDREYPPPGTLGYFYVPRYVSPTDIMIQRIASVIMSVMLVSVAGVPFTPIAWVLPLEGAYIVDWFVSDLALAGACYFRFQVASMTDALVVEFPVGGDSSRTVVRNGRMQRYELVPSWTWMPNYYWGYSLLEFLLLVGLLAHPEPNAAEIFRRIVSVVLVICWWYIGWSAAPRAHKTWAWDHIKQFWFWMAASRIFRGGWVAIRSFGRS